MYAIRIQITKNDYGFPEGTFFLYGTSRESYYYQRELGTFFTSWEKANEARDGLRDLWFKNLETGEAYPEIKMETCHLSMFTL